MIIAALNALDYTGLTMTAAVAIAFVAQPQIIRLRLLLKQRNGSITRWQDRVQLRFKRCGTHAYMFAWWKIRLDPMFHDLPVFMKDQPEPRVAFDLGCGTGIAGNTLLEWYPQLTIYGVDPDRRRVPVANKSFADRGKAFVAGAPDFEVPGLPQQFDAVFCLDMVHFLDKDQLQTTLNRLHARLEPGGHLYLRAIVPPHGRGSLIWKYTVLNRRLLFGTVHHRSIEEMHAMLAAAGFELLTSQAARGNLELHWFIARA